MTNTKQELIAIRDAKPNGATHVSDEHNYYQFSEPDWYYYHFVESKLCLCESHEHLPMGLRSLSDITAQITLLEQNEALEAEVAELESKLTDIHATKLDMGSYWSVAYHTLENEVI